MIEYGTALRAVQGEWSLVAWFRQVLEGTPRSGVPHSLLIAFDDQAQADINVLPTSRLAAMDGNHITAGF